jgi:hypothetical protein
LLVQDKMHRLEPVHRRDRLAFLAERCHEHDSARTGAAAHGSRFRWTTPAPATASTPATTLVVTSTAQQIEHDRCIRWTGPAIGTGLRIDRGVHVWTFIKVRGGVLVRTEESWTGPQIDADPATAIKYLAPGLDAWLADLKAAAEAVTPSA